MARTSEKGEGEGDVESEGEGEDGLPGPIKLTRSPSYESAHSEYEESLKVSAARRGKARQGAAGRGMARRYKVLHSSRVAARYKFYSTLSGQPHATQPRPTPLLLTRTLLSL